MKFFAALFQQIDQTNSTNEKVHLMQKFFSEQDSETSAWALYLLMGRRPKKLIGSAKLRVWLKEVSGYPDWLIEDCYSAVGDTAEMVSLIMGQISVDEKVEADDIREKSLGYWMTHLILPLMNQNDDFKKKTVTGWWRQLSSTELFIVNKFLTGALRVGVSEALVYRSLEKISGLPRTVIASRLLGSWDPSAAFFESLLLPVDPNAADDENKEMLPKPFCLAAPIEGHPKDLGDVNEWFVEWKWDGIRCQAVKFGDHLEFWSRGEERVTEAFPDLALELKSIHGDWIIDGELVAGSWQKPDLFQELQKRINRKKPTTAFQKENPVGFIAYDLLIDGKQDISQSPLSDRLDRLQQKITKAGPSKVFGVSPKLPAESWDALEKIQSTARSERAEGLMLKKKDSVYETGRKRGIWYKWKVEPLTVDAVLTSAQPGTGRRASLYTDYTFSIWKGESLVPIAKAYSGLTDAEIRELDQWIRKNTLERFGPVRSLKSEKVFELGFEGIAKSTRHKSGFAVRFPRILRERTDKKPEAANHVEDMDQLLNQLREHSV